METIQPYLFSFLLSSQNDKSDSSKKSFLPYLLMIGLPLMNYFPSKYIKDFILSRIKIKSPYIELKINTHEVPTVIRGSYGKNSSTKNIFSDAFLALIYFLEKNEHILDIQNLIEIMTNNSELNYCRNDSDEDGKMFTLVPKISSKIEIYIEDGVSIYCEVVHVDNNDDDDNENDKKQNNKILKKKQFIIILSIKNEKNNKICILRNFIKRCIDDYKLSIRKDKDDTCLYVYEYKKCEESESYTTLIFRESKMEHNKDLTLNIFFEGKQELIDYITPFKYDKYETFNAGEEMYKRSGFTFKAGLLFYGSPGCGKTSSIKAICKYTNRHPICINLGKIKTCEELISIFRNRQFKNNTLTNRQIIFIFEDCDAFESNIMKSRKNIEDEREVREKEARAARESSKKIEENSELNQISKMVDFTCVDIKNKFKDEDEINLSCFLNILDGIVELHGLMIIMTSNHPEKIDEALLRPGRFDFKYEFKKASKKIIKEMLQFKFMISDEDMEKVNVDDIDDNVLSPAEIQSVSFKHKDVDACICDLVKLAQSKIYV